MTSKHMKEIYKTYYCFNECKHHNHYDGWCYYHNKDIYEIDYIHCEVNNG